MLGTLLLATFTVLAAQAASVEPPPSEPRSVGGRIKEPVKLKNVPPKYPEDAKRAGIAGVVILECTISPKGDVTAAKVLRGLPLLDEAAIEAVRKWRYTPTLLDGVAVPVIMTITVNFKLDSVRLEDLIGSLRHENEDVREAAALGLQRLKGSGGAHGRPLRDAISALERTASKDESPKVRAAAERTLSYLDGRPMPGSAPAAPPAPSSDSGSTAEAAETAPWVVRLGPGDAATGGGFEQAALEFDSPPRVKKQARPEYPRAAFDAKIQGTVLVEALVGPDGKVEKARIIQSVRGLDDAALEAARKWEFFPGIRGGKPVATIIHMPVAFRIY